MDEFMRIVALTILCLGLAVLLKRDVPPMAMLVSLSLTVGVLLWLIRPLAEVNAFISRVADIAAVSGEILVPLLKAVAIAIVVRVFASLCRDATETAMASVVEITGAVTALTLMLPLFNAVLDLCGQLL